MAVWIYEDRLHIEYQQTVPARYKATLNRRRKSLKSVSRPQIYSTCFFFYSSLTDVGFAQKTRSLTTRNDNRPYSLKVCEPFTNHEYTLFVQHLQPLSLHKRNKRGRLFIAGNSPNREGYDPFPGNIDVEEHTALSF